jgi:hypothetical protein
MMRSVRSWADVRSAPIVAAITCLVLGMWFSLYWSSIAHGGPLHLSAPSDLWGLTTSSSAILHGNFAGVYVRNGALTSPPAFEFVLAPLLALGQALGLAPHLHVKGEPLSLWFILGPAALCIGSTTLFAVDAVARSWRMSERARLALALLGAVGVADVIFGWGHPEDCAALALVIWSALVFDRKGDPALPTVAWLLGVAIAFQPMALLGAVPILARCGRRAWVAASWRLAMPSLAVLAPELLTAAHQTLFVVVRQPFQPKDISFTPLTHVAPTLGVGVLGGGPTRLLSTALGALLALVVCRKRQDLGTVLGMIALAFTLRLLFETELNWYYFWPVSALCLLLAIRHSWPRFWLCGAALVGSAVVGNHRVHAIGLWWPTMMATMGVMVMTVVPWRFGHRPSPSTTMSSPPPLDLDTSAPPMIRVRRPPAMHR